MIVEQKNWQPVIFIRGEIASSKNSRRCFLKYSKRTGRKEIINLPSAFAASYMKNASKQLLVHKKYWQDRILSHGAYGTDLAIEVGFYFFRKSIARFDYVNVIQSLADEMVRTGYIQDDSMNYFKPVFLGWQKEPKNPGVQLYL